jgi:hypothetical protein
MKAKEFVLGVKFKVPYHDHVFTFVETELGGRIIERLQDENGKLHPFDISHQGIQLWTGRDGLDLLFRTQMYFFSKLTLVP